MSYQTENVPFIDGMNLGSGVNMVTGQAMGQVFTNLSTTYLPDPAVTAYNEQCIQTSDEYASLLEVASSAEGQAWTEGGKVSVSASADYLQQQKLSEQTLAFVLQKSVRTGSELASAAALAALQLPANLSTQILTNAAGFLDEFGTHVITGFISGGSFVGSAVIKSESQADMQTITATFSTSISDFDAAKGQLDTSFKQNLVTVAQTHSTVVDYSTKGVDPPTFSAGNIDTMQQYVDGTVPPPNTGFVTQLGDGVRTIAVCQPWESLSCVTSLPGYKAGSLSPAIDQGVLQTLRNEYRRLDYAVQTALAMQDINNNIFVSPGSAHALQNDITALYEAQAKIQALGFSDLQQLDQNSVQQYLVSTQYLSDLNQIASGRAEVGWIVQLDGAFKPNTQADPNLSKTGSNVVYPTSDGTPTIVMQANHSDGTISVGFVYQFIPVATGQQPPTKLQDQVQLMSYIKFNDDVYQGSAVTGSTNEPSSTHWANYTWDHIGVWFGS